MLPTIQNGALQEFYARTICTKVMAMNDISAELESIMSKYKPLDGNNPANPESVFTLERALHIEPQKVPAQFTDVNNYDMGHSNHTFPDERFVIRLTPEECMPRVFTTKMMPGHQDWIGRIAEQMHKQGDMPLVENEYDVSTAKDREGQQFKEFEQMSDFRKVEIEIKTQYKNIEKYEKTPDFRTHYEQFQKDAILQLKSRCFDPDAAISEAPAKIIAWGMNSSRSTAVIQKRLTYNGISVFGNRVIKHMENYEHLFLVSTAHLTLYNCMHSRLDAMRRCMDLHLNIIQTGEGATSKTFTFNLVKKASIEGSVVIISGMTRAAQDVDDNDNDKIRIFQEAQQSMMQQFKGQDNALATKFKEQLTSNTTSVLTFAGIDENTGKRKNRHTHSECIGVWFMATNDPMDRVEEALRTRFYESNAEKKRRIGRDIDDCMAGEREMQSSDNKARKAFFQELKEEQWRVFASKRLSGLVSSRMSTQTP